MRSLPPLQTSLRCLASPFSWGSILVLLINDHLLKWLYPSWLTGKLSDFAGLFFTPFLVAVPLALLLKNRRGSAYQAGFAAIFLVGLGFGSIKLTLGANMLANKWMTQLWGMPIHFIFDPTDIVGLAVLWGTWWLWKNPPKFNYRKVGWLALIFGSLAAVATTPAEPIPHYKHLAYYQSNLYAADTEYWGEELLMAVSEDLGRSWEWVSRDIANQLTDIFQLENQPQQVCSQENPAQCYRIGQDVEGYQSIEVTGDGGNTWGLLWEFPPGRREFMQRYEQRYILNFGLPKEIDQGPFDLLLVEMSTEHYLLAAMGNEGVMRMKLPQGDWERFEVVNAAPTPYALTNFGAILITLRQEMLGWVVFTLLMLLVTAHQGWGVGQKFRDPTNPVQSSAFKALAPLWIWGFLGILGGGILWLVVGEYPGSWLMIVIGGVIVAAGYAVTWNRIAKLFPSTSFVQQAGIWYGLTGLGFLISGWGVWILWARGTIPTYYQAWITALILSVVVLLAGYRRAKKMLLSASTGSN